MNSGISMTLHWSGSGRSQDAPIGDERLDPIDGRPRVLDQRLGRAVLLADPVQDAADHLRGALPRRRAAPARRGTARPRVCRAMTAISVSTCVGLRLAPRRAPRRRSGRRSARVPASRRTAQGRSASRRRRPAARPPGGTPGSPEGRRPPSPPPRRAGGPRHLLCRRGCRRAGTASPRRSRSRPRSGGSPSRPSPLRGLSRSSPSPSRRSAGPASMRAMAFSRFSLYGRVDWVNSR